MSNHHTHCGKCHDEPKCNECNECVKCKRGKRGKTGPIGPIGPTGPAGGPGGNPKISSDSRIVIFNTQTDDPQVIIDSTGPGNYDGHLGFAFASNNLQVIVFVSFNSVWRAV